MLDQEPIEGEDLLAETRVHKLKRRGQIRTGCMTIMIVSLLLTIIMRDRGFALAWLPCCLAPFVFLIFTIPIVNADGNFENRRTFDDTILVMHHSRLNFNKSNSLLLQLFMLPGRLFISSAILFMSMMGCSVSYYWAAVTGRRGRKWLANRLQAEKPYDRWRACRYIKFKATQEEIAALEARLADKEPYVIEAAIDALAQIPDYRPSPEMLKAAESDDDIVKLQAISSLYRLDHPVEIDEALLTRVVNLMDFSQVGEPSRFLKMLKPLPPGKVIDTVAALYDAEPECRHAITLFVSEKDYGPESINLVHRSLQSEELLLVCGALIAAQKCGTKETLSYVQHFINEPDPDVRRSAQWAEKAILKRIELDSAKPSDTSNPA